MKLGNSLQPPDGYPEHSFDTRTNLVLFFWWFGHVLEQTLCIPFTRPTHFSLFKGIAAIPEQNQTNDALPS